MLCTLNNVVLVGDETEFLIFQFGCILQGQRFEADLLPSGKIRWQGSEEEFSTPSAWATHCKRLVNPIKRSGCGWASVGFAY